MKKFVLVFVTAFILTLTVNAQEFIYSSIVGTGRLFSTKVDVSIDFGQQTKLLTDNRLRDEKGQVIVFNSMVDAMNYMGADGWEFVQAYVVTIGNQNVYHWLLKKRIDLLTDDEKTEVFKILRIKKN